MTVAADTHFLVIAVIDQFHLAGANGTHCDDTGFRLELGSGHCSLRVTTDRSSCKRKTLANSSVETS